VLLLLLVLLTLLVLLPLACLCRGCLVARIEVRL